MVAVLLSLIFAAIAGLAAYVAVVRMQEGGRRQRQSALEQLARVQGIDVAIRVGQALGWIEDAKRAGDAVSIRVR